MRIRMQVLAAVLLAAVVTPVSAQVVSVERVTYSCAPDDGYGNPYAEVIVHLSDGGTRTLQASACNANAVAYAVGVALAVRQGDNAYSQLLSVTERQESFASSPLRWVLASWPLLLGVAIGVTLLFFNVYIVRQQTEYIIERFGKFHRKQSAGLRGKIPFIERIAQDYDLRQQQEVLKVDTKTKDDVFMDVFPAVQYRIVDTEKAFYGMDDIQQQMETYTQNIVRSVVPSMTMNEVFQKKEELAERIERDLAPKLLQYGIKVVDVPIKDLAVPEEIENARNKKVTQESLLEANRHRGEAQKVLVIAAAEAKRDQDRLHGEGIALQREAIARGFEESVKAVSGAGGLDPREASRFLAFMQYVDAIKDVGSNAKHVLFLPSGPGAVGDLMQQITAAISASGAEALPGKPGGANGKDKGVEAPAS